MGNSFSGKKKKKFKLTPEQIKEYITDDGDIDMDKLRDEYDNTTENKKKPEPKKKKKQEIKFTEEIQIIQEDDNVQITENEPIEDDNEFEVQEKDVELVVDNEPEQNVRIAKPAFDTLVEALYDAGIKANRSVQISNLYHLDWYFENFKEADEDNDEQPSEEKVEKIIEEKAKILNESVLQPRMVKIRIPSPDPNNEDNWKVIEVPLFTLVKHNSLKIDTMDVELKFNMGKIVKKTELKNNKFHHSSKKSVQPLTKKKWKIRIATPVRENSSFATLKIKFSYDSPLESITRLTERYDRFL
jgi:hypothetical protein